MGFACCAQTRLISGAPLCHGIGTQVGVGAYPNGNRRGGAFKKDAGFKTCLIAQHAA